MRRSALRRRGDTQYTLSRTLDIIFSIFVILLVLVLVVAIWRALYGADKQALKQYQLMGDMLQGVIESPATGEESRREFVFRFDLAEGRESYKGTIFGISSDGTFTTPIPPLTWYYDESTLRNLFGTSNDRSGLSASNINGYIKSMEQANPGTIKASKWRTCEGKACLCFSKNAMSDEYEDGKYDMDSLLKALNGITECKAYEIPTGHKLIFDFESLQQGGEFKEGEYPTVSLLKKDCPGNPDGYTCIYAELKGTAP